MGEVLIGLGVGIAVAVGGYVLAFKLLKDGMGVLLAAVERATAAVAYPRYPASEIEQVDSETEAMFADLGVDDDG